MPKINQTIVIVPGGAKRLMVRGKRGMKVVDNGLVAARLANGSLQWAPDRTPVPLNGPYIGTRKVPASNAKKHPATRKPQTQYVLVKHPRRDYTDNIHAVPPSDVEFYWQKGQMKNGRFYPDKEDVTLPDQQPAPATP